MPSAKAIQKGLQLLMDKAARLKRAKQMGFDTERTWYHGTKGDIEQFDPAMRGRTFPVGSSKGAFWFTSDPGLAEGYAKTAKPGKDFKTQINKLWDQRNKLVDLHRRYQRKFNELTTRKSDFYQPFGATDQADLDKVTEGLQKIRKTQDGIRTRLDELSKHEKEYGAAILPAHLKMQKPLTIDMKGRFYDEAEFDTIMNRAKREGYDSVQFKNVRDPAGSGEKTIVSDVSAVFEPEQIRSKFAKFDPTQAKSGKIAAGTAGAVALLRPPEAQAGETPFGTRPEDAFLHNIGMIESAGGKNIKHQKMTRGMHKGMRAMGRYGLMPKTVKEMIDRMEMAGEDVSDIQFMRKISPEKQRYVIENNPDMELRIARFMARDVLGKQKGNEEKAAYTWFQGHNLSPESVERRGYKDHFYVQRFQKHEKTNPYRQKPTREFNRVNKLFAPPPSTELPEEQSLQEEEQNGQQ